MAGSDGIRQGFRKRTVPHKMRPLPHPSGHSVLSKHHGSFGGYSFLPLYLISIIPYILMIGFSKCSVLMFLLRYSPDPDFPEEISTSSNTLINQKNTNNTRIGITQDVISITATASTKWFKESCTF